MPVQKLAFYQEKLAYEIDSWDPYVALGAKQQLHFRPTKNGGKNLRKNDPEIKNAVTRAA